MEWSLKKDIYEELAAIWTGSTVKEFSLDCVVPDTMPDVASVVDAEGIILLRSKDVETGGVSLTSSIAATVMYIPEDGGILRCLSAAIPVELRFDVPEIDTDCRVVAGMRVRAIDARMVNSRKISLRADVEGEIRCYRKTETEIASGLEDSAVHTLNRTLSFVRTADVREKTFVITDDYSLPIGMSHLDSILSQRGEVTVEDAKFVSGKVVFRGRVKAGLLLAGEEPGQILSARYETEFSQIMEVDASGDVEPEVSLMFTGVYFDLPDREDENGRISAEIHMAAQCVCRQRAEMSYIADLYSNQASLIPEMNRMRLVGSVHPVSMRQTVAGRVEPFVGNGEMISLSGAIGVIATDGNTVKTTVNIRLVSRSDEGQYLLSRCRLSAEFTAELPEEAELENIRVSVAEVYYTASGSGTDIRAALQLDALAYLPQTIEYVSSVAEDEASWEREKETPSITLVRAEPGMDMWKLAKRYHSTVEAIAAVNSEKEEGLLLIPKSR